MKVPLPTSFELEGLPQGAVLALVTQCLSRLEPIVQAISMSSETHVIFRRAIELVEGYANGHIPTEQDCMQTAQELSDLSKSAYDHTFSNDSALHLRYALESAGLAICIPVDILKHRGIPLSDTAAMSIERALKGLARASSVPLYTVDFDYECLPEARDIRQDLDLLVASFKGFEANSAVVAPNQFFDLHWQCESNFGAQGIIVSDVAATMALSILERASRHPDEFYGLTPREFEIVVAELMRQFGFEVELTSETRDGGYDIIAVSRRPLNLRFLIECKRYGRHHKVDVGIVRALHGVAIHEKSTKAIIVTTSWFTKPAQELLNQHRWLLEGRDFDGLMDWLAIFRQTRFSLKYETFLAAQAVLRRKTRPLSCQQTGQGES